MSDGKVLLSHSMIAVCAQGKQQVTILISVHNAGASRTKELSLIGSLQESLSDSVFSCDGGESWQLWQGSCAIGAIESKGEVVLLLQGKQEEHLPQREMVLEVASLPDGIVECRMALSTPVAAQKNTAQHRYLCYDVACNRHCCLL